MAKKNRKPEVEKAPELSETIVFEGDQTLYEAEAYGSPQPEAGSDVTVMKTVGIGGPVPIVAPKHNTIQLQPIVVPLAVVPYMTQDSGVLRTDGKGQGYQEDYAEAAEFSTAQTEKAKKAKSGVHPRLLVLFSMLISAALFLPFILAYFKNALGNLNFAGADHFNVIGIIANWIATKSVPTGELYRDIIFIAAFVAIGLSLIVEIIALMAGKYPRAFIILSSLVSAGTSIAILVIDIVKKAFVASDRIALIVFIAVALLGLLLAIIFTVVLNRADDKADRARVSSEI